MALTFHPGGEIPELFAAFGINILVRWKGCQTPEQIVEIFTRARIEAKVRYRALALNLHPDRGGDGEKLKVINAKWDRLQKAQIHPQTLLGPKSALTVSAAVQKVRGTPFVTFVGVGYDPGVSK